MLADHQHFQRTTRALHGERSEGFLRRVPPARAAGAYSVYEGAVPGARHTSRMLRVLKGSCAGYHLRALLVHEVFKKVLYLAPTARGEFSSGRVFNLVTSDAETLQAGTRLHSNLIGLVRLFADGPDCTLKPESLVL